MIADWYDMAESQVREWEEFIRVERAEQRASAPAWELVPGFGIRFDHDLHEPPRHERDAVVPNETLFQHPSQQIPDGNEVIHHDGFNGYNPRRERRAHENALIVQGELVLYRYVDTDTEDEFVALGKVVHMAEEADTTCADTLLQVSWLRPVNDENFLEEKFMEALTIDGRRVLTSIPRGAILASSLKLNQGMYNTAAYASACLNVASTEQEDA